MIKEKFRLLVYSLLKALVWLVFPRHTITGAENVNEKTSSVFICNHAGKYGPVAMALYFPFRFKPWVIHHITSVKLCRKYLEADFIKNDLKVRGFAGRCIAAVIAPLFVGIIKSSDPIPVFRGHSKVLNTFRLSIEALKQGHHLVIFPENMSTAFSGYLKDFRTGFVHLARQYYRQVGEKLNFYPVYASSKKRVIAIGKPITYTPDADFDAEKQHIAGYLRNTIQEIAVSLESV